MKSIDKETVKQVALLSRLELDAKEVDLYAGQLASILSYISKLNEVDTGDAAPTAHPLSTLKNVFRKDVLKQSARVEDVLRNAPAKEGGFFRVPQVIEGK